MASFVKGFIFLPTGGESIVLIYFYFQHSRMTYIAIGFRKENTMNTNNVISMLGSNGIEARLDAIVKNGVEKEAILVGGDDVKMVVYTDMVQGLNDEEATSRIIDLVKSQGMLDIDTSIFRNWELAKDKVLAGIRKRTNDPEVITSPFHEFEIYPYLSVGSGVAKVTWKMLEIYGIYKLDLLSAAYDNTFETIRIRELDDLMAELLDSARPCRSNDRILVVTSEEAMLGAIGMWYDDVLRTCCRRLKCEQILILPSSIHELMVIDANEANVSMINCMIRDINKQCVDPLEQLGDRSYIYNMATNDLSVAIE